MIYENILFMSIYILNINIIKVEKDINIVISNNFQKKSLYKKINIFYIISKIVR